MRDRQETRPPAGRERTARTVCSLFASLLLACAGTTPQGSHTSPEQHPDSLAALGAKYLSVGDPTTAAREYLAALEIDPRHEPSLRAMMEMSASGGDLASATSFLDKLEASNHAKPDDYLEVSDAAPQTDASIALLRRGLDGFPDSPELSAALGAKLIASGQSGEGMRILEGLQDKPGEPGRIALRTLADVYFDREEYGSALPVLRKLDKRSPDDFHVNMRLAFIYFQREKYDEAVSYYRRASQIRPKSVDARVALAKTYEKQGLTNDAVRAYDKAIDLRGMVREMEPVILGLANGYNKLGRFDKTLRLIAQCERKFPLSPGLHCAQGMALAANGDYDGAVAAFSKATGDRTYASFARQQIRRINSLRKQVR